MMRNEVVQIYVDLIVQSYQEIMVENSPVILGEVRRDFTDRATAFILRPGVWESINSEDGAWIGRWITLAALHQRADFRAPDDGHAILKWSDPTYQAQSLTVERILLLACDHLNVSCGPFTAKDRVRAINGMRHAAIIYVERMWHEVLTAPAMRDTIVGDCVADLVQKFEAGFAAGREA